MEEVNITELEARYFLDLFLCCDIEKTGKVPVLKATEMFRSANIPNEILKNIMSLAGIPQTALHMSKVQFYSCLKLIAAHQHSVPLRQELIASTVTLPLPKFSWKESPIQLRTEILNGKISDLSRWRSSTSHSPNLIELARLDAQSDVANSDITSTDSEVEHNENDNKSHTRRVGSPEAWSTASDSPTPTNSVAERPWAKNALWQGLLSEEQTQLLGTEEESSDRHSSEEDNDTDLETVYQITKEQKEYYIKQFRTIQPDLKGLLSGQAAKVFFEKSRIPVEELRHIWQLCDVTKDGALNLAEFAAAMHLVVLRRNNIPLPPILPECLIPSNNLFEVAQPVEGDLLHLDDDKTEDAIASTTSTTIPDASSLSFNSPFVTRQHPIKLVGKHTSNSPTNVTSAKVLPTNNSNKGSTSSNSPPNDVGMSPTKPKAIGISKDWINQSSKEWTKFTESPTSNVSSPGPKPVNFDMQRTAQAVVSDPQILHPVPLRITPVGTDVIDDESSRVNHQRKSENFIYDGGIITIRDSGTSSPKQQHHNAQHRDSGTQKDLRAIQRPQPKKIQMKNNIGAIPPPPQRESLTSGTLALGGSNDLTDGTNAPAPVLHSKKEIPPPPPPRPHKHARSSSLDLNKLKLNAPVPPEVPPRVSPQVTAQISLDAQLETGNSSFADFTQFSEPGVEASQNQPQSIDPDDGMPLPPRVPIPSFQSSQRSSAFEVYRKPTPRESISPSDSLATKNADRSFAEHSRAIGTYKNDSKNLNDVMCHLKEQNLLLITMCSDLSEELLTVQQKKLELKAKIESEPSSGSGSSSMGLANSKELGNQSTV